MVMDLQDAYRMQQYGYQRAEEDRVARLKALTHEDWLATLEVVHESRIPERYLFTVARSVQNALRSVGLEFCFIGGIPLQYWGEPRATTDVDLTVLCDLGQEESVLEKLKSVLEPRTDDTDELALIGRMYLATSPSGVQVDISLGFTPYEHRLMERAADLEFGVYQRLHCCSAEDLTILKTIAGRDRDWGDILRIIHRNGSSIDWNLVFEEVSPLLALTNSPESESRLREMLE